MVRRISLPGTHETLARGTFVAFLATASTSMAVTDPDAGTLCEHIVGNIVDKWLMKP
jgi:hypothetical protein